MFNATPASQRLPPLSRPSSSSQPISSLNHSPNHLHSPINPSPSPHIPARSPLPVGTLPSYNNALSGPSFSRFLSNSIVNPLARSRFFPSTVSENPLFYSTREGYEIGLTEDDDILPHEHSLQLQHSLAHPHGRAIDDDEPPDSHESHFFHHAPHHSVVQGKRPAGPPPDGLYCDEDDHPFYEHPATVRPTPHTNPLPIPDSHLPRNLLASQALSNLMASEIALGPDDYEPSPTSLAEQQQQQQQQQQQSSSHGRWRAHEAVGPPETADDGGQQAPCRPAPRLVDPSDLARTTQDLPKHPLLRPVPPERAFYTSEDPEPYPVAPNHVGALVEGPTVYIYPTEARDIGSDVSGLALGPQGYRDGFWLGAWLCALVYAFCDSVWVLVMSSGPGSGSSARAGLMASLPVLALLITLTFGLCLGAMALLVLVKRSIRLLVYATAVGVPAVLGLVGLWTWSESLAEPDAGGLGYISLVTVALCGLVVHVVWQQRARIGRTVRVLELATGVVIEHPSLVLVALALSLASMLMSVPFLTVVYQLVLRGYGTHPRWTLVPTSAAQLLAAGLVWSWTLNVVRSLQRIIIAGVVAHWYFNRHPPPGPGRPAYSPLETTCQAIGRALGPSLGTVCLSGLLLTCLDSLSKLTGGLKRLSGSGRADQQHGLVSFLAYRNPVAQMIWSIVGPLVAISARMFEFMNGYTVIYAGITGFRFCESTKKVAQLMSRNGQIHLVNNLSVKMMLNLISLTISLTFSLIGYKIWTLRILGISSSFPIRGGGSSSSPSDNNSGEEGSVGWSTVGFEESLVFMFSGLLPFWILRFCTDLVAGAVDTLFLCWNIDLDIGTNHSSKTRQAFTGKD